MGLGGFTHKCLILKREKEKSQQVPPLPPQPHPGLPGLPGLFVPCVCVCTSSPHLLPRDKGLWSSTMTPSARDSRLAGLGLTPTVAVATMRVAQGLQKNHQARDVRRFPQPGPRSGGGGWGRDGGEAEGQRQEEKEMGVTEHLASGLRRTGSAPVTSWDLRLSEVHPHRKGPWGLHKTCYRWAPLHVLSPGLRPSLLHSPV